MAASNKGYSTFADFERDQLRPDMRIGFTTDELEASGEELDFDLDPDKVPRDYYAGDPILSLVMSSLSNVFPEGERFFVRSVNHFLDHPAVQADPELVAQVRGFFGQEGRHARAHEDYNDMLRAHGYPVDRFLARVDRVSYGWVEQRTPPELRLAATAAADPPLDPPGT